MRKRWTAAWVVSAVGIFGWSVTEIRRNKEIVREMEAVALGDPLPAIPRTADVNEDGQIDLDDILWVMAAFRAEQPRPHPCPEDICCCGPHVVDLDDLLAVMAAVSGKTEICAERDCPQPPPMSLGVEVFEDGGWVRVARHADRTFHIQAGQRMRYVAEKRDSSRTGRVR